MEIQPADFINKNKLLFAEGNAIKYICRHKAKGKEKRCRESNSLLRNDNRKGLQIMCTVPQVSELDLTDIDIVAIDLETYDPNLKTKGLGAVRKDGFVTGIAIATKKQTFYFPIATCH